MDLAGGIWFLKQIQRVPGIPSVESSMKRGPPILFLNVLELKGNAVNSK